MQQFQQIEGPMTAERLKQEAALRALAAWLLPALAESVGKGMAKPTKPEFSKWLVRFEDTAASRLGAIAEAVGEAFVKKFGPDIEEDTQ